MLSKKARKTVDPSVSGCQSFVNKPSPPWADKLSPLSPFGTCKRFSFLTNERGWESAWVAVRPLLHRSPPGRTFLSPSLPH